MTGDEQLKLETAIAVLRNAERRAQAEVGELPNHERMARAGVPYDERMGASRVYEANRSRVDAELKTLRAIRVLLAKTLG
jgi:hypothetical protein|tara:strand:+ start:257 stop:496 length:240 start_codon:yes stop_codon:yes gene_type:complete